MFVLTVLVYATMDSEEPPAMKLFVSSACMVRVWRLGNVFARKVGKDIRVITPFVKTIALARENA